MSTLQQRRHLACSYPLARIFLENRLGPLADSETPVRLTLAAPIRGLVLAPSTQVSIVVGRYPEKTAHADQAWRIHWFAKGSRTLPEFDGTLAVAFEENDRSFLELRGAYSPPFGLFGRVFDALVGSRIARATARALLEDFAADIERHDRARAGDLAETLAEFRNGSEV